MFSTIPRLYCSFRQTSVMTRKDSKEFDAQRSRLLSCPNPKQENQLILGMRWRTHYLHCHPTHVRFDVVNNGVSYLLHQGQAIHVILSFKMDSIFHSHLEGIAWHEVVWILYKRVAWFWSSYTRPSAFPPSTMISTSSPIIFLFSKTIFSRSGNRIFKKVSLTGR